MAKKGLILILILSTLLSLASCGSGYRSSLDENLHDQIQLVFEEDGYEPSHIVYKSKKYIFAEKNAFLDFEVNRETDVLLSWNGNRYWGYIDEYYSYTTESPLFIYYKTWFFYSEDYNYLEDTFSVEDSCADIIWKDIFDSEQTGFNFINPITMFLYSKSSPRIKIKFEMVCVDNKWYLSLPGTQTVWRASDEFVKILSENGII